MLQPLDPRTKDITQRAIARVTPFADALGLMFYARLFELDPALRVLFKTDLQDQAHALITMLQLCIEGLDERADLQQTLKNLGARHLWYGAKPRHYATVHSALMWTMREGLGDDWDAETEAALQTVFQLFIDEMQRVEITGEQRELT